MNSSEIHNNWLRLIGNALSVLGIVFVCHSVYDKSSSLPSIEFSTILLQYFLITVLLWQLVNTSIGVGWGRILSLLNCNIPTVVSLYLCFLTQIAKYVPGNVFHLVGRAVAIPKKEGGKGLVSFSLVLESVILVLEGIAVWILYGIFDKKDYTLLIVPPLFAFFGVLIIVKLVKRLLSLKFLPKDSIIGYKKVFWSCLSYYLVFLLQTSMFIIILVALEVTETVEFWSLHSILVVSWVAGYLVIGAPGGLGVREGVFTAMVAGVSSSPSLIVALILLRCATMLGDTLSYIGALLVSKRIRKMYSSLSI